jgi:predicted amidohydrolase YtcJ
MTMNASLRPQTHATSRLSSAHFQILQKLIGLALLVILSAEPLRPAPQTPASPGDEADLVLFEGKVITVDPSDSVVEGVAVKGGHIVAAGRNSEISKWIGKQTQVVHLGGKSVLPGLIDAHTHLEGIAAFHRMLDVHVPPLKGVDEILDSVRGEVSKKKSGEWIVGAGGWGQVLPNRQQLDSVAPDNPVVLRESAHVQILNSKALQALGIDRNTVPPLGGNIYKDPATGEPTGKIQEMPQVWQSKIPPPSYEVRKQSVKEVMEDFTRKGVTSVYDFPSGDGMRIYQELREEHQLPVRLRWQIIVSQSDLGFAHFVINYGPRTGFGDDWLRLGGIKLFVDGETESAVRYEPAGQREKWVGGLRFTQEQLNDIVLRAHKSGFQIWTHALGDKAQDMILEAYERAETAAPRPDPRHRIEHAGNNEAGPTTVEQLERMKRLGVIPVPTGAWIYLGHAAFKTQAKVPFIYRSMLDHGLRPPGTSDSLGSMPESMNPFFSMWAMVTRKTREGELNGAEEAISVKEAIRGYTIDGAYSGFEEKSKGSIEPGKLADLIVVSADPLTIPSDQIKDIQVLMTVVNGKIVWRNNM